MGMTKPGDGTGVGPNKSEIFKCRRKGILGVIVRKAGGVSLGTRNGR